MKALSIRQLWAWAILYAGKNIENRDWHTHYRGKFAIHAAKGMTPEEYRTAVGYITKVWLNPMLTTHGYQIGAATAKAADGGLVLPPGGLVLPPFEDVVRGAIIGAANLADCVRQSDSPWFEGKYGFVLTGAIALPKPIPCKGALNFWDVPPDIAAQVEAQLRGINHGQHFL